MNTFLPYPDFAASAACLDRARLGKQRVEVLQLLLGQFPNHPASKMWRGYEPCLLEYGFAICEEWHHIRGYKDSVADKLTDLMLERGYESSKNPPWLGDEAFHASHRSNLLRKDLMFYGRYGWTEHCFLPYVWPKL